MAKRYPYMYYANNNHFIFGVVIMPLEGIVETTWKVPTKYRQVAETLSYSYNTSDNNGIRLINEDEILFSRIIDYSEIFENLICGDPLCMLQEIEVKKNDAINDAAYQVVRLKENFQDAVRSRFYAERLIKNPCRA
jgi:hypothetical protein